MGSQKGPPPIREQPRKKPIVNRFKITEEVHSQRTYNFDIEASKNLPRLPCILSISRFIYNIFQSEIRFLYFFQYFLPCFCTPLAFWCFPLRKATSCSRYAYWHFHELNFFSNLGSDNTSSLLLSLWTY